MHLQKGRTENGPCKSDTVVQSTTFLQSHKNVQIRHSSQRKETVEVFFVDRRVGCVDIETDGHLEAREKPGTRDILFFLLCLRS